VLGDLRGFKRGRWVNEVAILAELEAFLKKRHPKLTRKPFKTPPMVRFIDGEDHWSVITHEQTAAEVIRDNEKPEVGPSGLTAASLRLLSNTLNRACADPR